MVQTTVQVAALQVQALAQAVFLNRIDFSKEECASFALFQLLNGLAQSIKGPVIHVLR